jgi:hypothetical protein
MSVQPVNSEVTVSEVTVRTALQRAMLNDDMAAVERIAASLEHLPPYRARIPDGAALTIAGIGVPFTPMRRDGSNWRGELESGFVRLMEEFWERVFLPPNRPSDESLNRTERHCYGVGIIRRVKALAVIGPYLRGKKKARLLYEAIEPLLSAGHHVVLCLEEVDYNQSALEHFFILVRTGPPAAFEALRARRLDLSFERFTTPLVELERNRIIYRALMASRMMVEPGCAPPAVGRMTVPYPSVGRMVSELFAPAGWMQIDAPPSAPSWSERAANLAEQLKELAELWAMEAGECAPIIEPQRGEFELPCLRYHPRLHVSVYFPSGSSAPEAAVWRQAVF